MKLIVGLGNPGEKYLNTRHNVGFMCLDRLADDADILINKAHSRGIYGKGVINQTEVLLFKPLTYMNLSGEAVRSIVDYFKISLEDILVIYDDFAFDIGDFKLRESGSAGGHNGMKSVINNLNTEDIKRIRIGINSEHLNNVDFVLSKFKKSELETVESVINKVNDAVYYYLGTSFSKAMNKFN
ncbi:MAG: aminoacyl-tRNA hydrolase [Erysipelotrichaceae bacterium]|jgi:PTH1 family peptidyl-tRNA hydrolase|nr:aminoacyl-tRNA hydrolase [Erysipelotrichaceae bacterium]